MNKTIFGFLIFLGIAHSNLGSTTERIPICQCNGYESLARAGLKSYKISLIDSETLSEVLIIDKAFRSKSVCHETIYELALRDFCTVSYKVENRD
jgi:hypothetical protein